MRIRGDAVRIRGRDMAEGAWRLGQGSLGRGKIALLRLKSGTRDDYTPAFRIWGGLTVRMREDDTRTVRIREDSRLC